MSGADEAAAGPSRPDEAAVRPRSDEASRPDEAAAGPRGDESSRPTNTTAGPRGDEASRPDEAARAEPPRAHRIKERLAERREAHARRSRFYRIGFAIVGATVTLAGLAMLVTPGPAFVVIPIGLAMLALEFAWAERLLDRALDHAEVAARKASETTAAQRILGGVAAALAIAAAVTAWLIWEIPLIPG